MDADVETLKRRVEAARILKGIPRQADLADALGMSSQTLLHRYNGQHDWKPHELYAVARICGVPEWFLLRGLEEADPNPEDSRFRLVTDPEKGPVFTSPGSDVDDEADLAEDLLNGDQDGVEDERGLG